MTTQTLSGYLAAAAAVVFSGTQQINSLTDNEYTDLSDELDNTTPKYELVDLYLELGSAAFTGADSGAEVYLVPSVDGTNYPTWVGNTTTDQQTNGQFLVGVMPLAAATQAQKAVLRGVPLPNGKYKYALRSRANVTLAGSGNTLYWRPHGMAF